METKKLVVYDRKPLMEIVLRLHQLPPGSPCHPDGSFFFYTAEDDEGVIVTGGDFNEALENLFIAWQQRRHGPPTEDAVRYERAFEETMKKLRGARA